MMLDILGLGHAVADRNITNDDLSQIMDTNDEWIVQRTGIKERKYSTVNTKELALNAAKKALADANVSADEIDVVICATITPECITPSTACMILNELGIKRAMAFDLNAACSGFIYALNVASGLLMANNLNKALVIGAEVLSKIIDYTDRSTAILFGDGAGAAVISAKHNNASFICNAKTDIDNVLYAKGITQGELFQNSSMNDYYLKMNGQEVYKFAITSCEEIIKDILNKNNLTMDDIDLVIPHQANVRIIQSFSKKLGIDEAKVYINLDKYGNTSAASVAIALSEVKEKNLIKKGDKLLLVGFGAGLTWAATVIEF